MDTATALRIPLAQVALLARVQRPVVSMWVTRYARSADPFPQPIATDAGVDLYDAEEVGAWLRRTGRGNNPDAAQDAAAFAVTGSGDELVFEGITALLALKVATGAQLGDLDDGDLLDLADLADPDDGVLYSEVAQVANTGRLGALARWADSAAAAAFHPAAAFEKLLDRHTTHSRTTLTGPGRRLAARLATALSDGGGTFADPTPGGGDLLVALAEDIPGLTACTGSGTDAASRLARRRLRVHDIYRAPLGGARCGTVVAQLPPPGAPTMTVPQVLDAVDEVALGLGPGHRALVLGPAAALTRALAARGADAVRAQLIRSGAVRAIVDLPKGLLRGAPQRHLALWVLAHPRPDLAPEQRWCVVADLSNQPLGDGEVEDLATDLASCLAGAEQMRAHAFRFAQIVAVPRLLGRKGSLTVLPDAARHPRGGAGAARAAELLDRLRDPLALVAVDAGVVSASDPVATVSVGELLHTKQVRVQHGTRLGSGHVGAAGARVIGRAELHDPAALGRRRVDAATLAAHYPRSHYTEPGDVVFCTSPAPAALVDRQGTSVVEYPARVLRVAPGAALAPDILAHAVNALPPQAKQWWSWLVRKTSPDQAAALAALMAAVDAQRDTLTQRARLLDELAATVLDGVAHGNLNLDPPTEGP